MARSIQTGLALAVVAAVVVGCAPKNEGVKREERIERRVGEGSQLGSADLAAATDKMIASIARVPEIRDNEKRTVIVMDEVENRTSMPAEEYEIFLARLRSMMNQSGLRQDIVFVEDRAKAERIKQREGYPADATARTLPSYAISATFYDLPRGGSNYHLLTFQLFDFTNDVLVWEDSYEVKLSR